MDYATDLHLMLDDELVEITARQHPDMPDRFFINLKVPDPGRVRLCFSGTAAQLVSMLDRMRSELTRTLDRELVSSA
jgi:hypothetical protein